MKKRKIFYWVDPDSDYVTYLNLSMPYSIPCDQLSDNENDDDPEYTLFLSRLEEDGTSYILKADERIGLTKSFKYEEDDPNDVGQEDDTISPPYQVAASSDVEEDYEIFRRNLRISGHDLIFHCEDDLVKYDLQVLPSPSENDNHGHPSSSKKMSKPYSLRKKSIISHQESDLSRKYDPRVLHSQHRDNNHGHPSSSKEMSKPHLHCKKSRISHQESDLSRNYDHGILRSPPKDNNDGQPSSSKEMSKPYLHHEKSWIFHHEGELSIKYDPQVSQHPSGDDNHGHPSSSKKMSRLYLDSKSSKNFHHEGDFSVDYDYDHDHPSSSKKMSKPYLRSKNSGSCSGEDKDTQQGNMRKKCSKFRVRIMRILRKPYDKEEHQNLLHEIKVKKPQHKHIDLRSGGTRFTEGPKLGNSYLDYYGDLKRKVVAAARDECKQLNLLRGYFFWIQNLPQEGSFIPWKDKECLVTRPEA